MNALAVALGPAFPEGVKRYRRKLFIDLCFFLKYRPWYADPAEISATSSVGNDVLNKLQSGLVQDIVDAAYLMGEVSAADLADVRAACRVNAPELLEIVDSLVWLAREELAEKRFSRPRSSF